MASFKFVSVCLVLAFGQAFANYGKGKSFGFLIYELIVFKRLVYQYEPTVNVQEKSGEIKLENL